VYKFIAQTVPDHAITEHLHEAGFFLELNARHTHISEDGLTIHQTLIDPDDLNDWSVHLTLDLEKSNKARTPVLHLESIAPI
jgi:hypothetical protein